MVGLRNSLGRRSAGQYPRTPPSIAGKHSACQRASQALHEEWEEPVGDAELVALEAGEREVTSEEVLIRALQCTDGLATPHSAFLNLIELTRGGSAPADSPLVTRWDQACLVESGRRCCQ